MLGRSFATIDELVRATSNLPDRGRHDRICRFVAVLLIWILDECINVSWGKVTNTDLVEGKQSLDC